MRAMHGMRAIHRFSKLFCKSLNQNVNCNQTITEILIKNYQNLHLIQNLTKNLTKCTKVCL